MFDAIYHGTPGASAWLALANPGPTLSMPLSRDMIALDPSSIMVVAAQVIAANGQMQAQIPIPANPLIRGTPIAAQGIEITATGSFALSAPVVVVLH